MKTRKLFIIVIFILGLFFFAKGASAATFYVAKTGSDSYSCSQAQSQSTPKLTISSAFACLGTGMGAGAGHTVEVAAGTYDESFFNTIPGGISWSAPFTWKAKPGDTVIVRPSAGPRVLIIGNAAGVYIIIDHIIFDGVNLSNTMVDLYGPAGYIRMQYCKFVNCKGSGMSWSPNGEVGAAGSHNELLHCSIHIVGSGPLDHGIYAGDSHDNLIEYCDIYNTSGYALHLYTTGDKVGNNIIRNNSLHDNPTNAIVLSTSGNVVYNNLIYNNIWGGIQIEYGDPDDNLIYNNTIYNNGVYGVFVGAGVTCTVISTNIIYAHSWTAIDDRGTGTIQSNNLTTKPFFINASINNFHLQSTSPAINTGYNLAGVVNTDFDGVSRPQGSGYDIGAYEYISLPSDTTPPSAPRAVRVQLA